ncbi:MAG: hypothetical protein INQ03_09160 [Candidatus Heimdallarchaeota archaeon]|nr:hypothetical protein [Candidatus Heimdallarchaeota archaeon]
MSKYINKIAKSWDHILEVKNSQGYILDGYWADEYLGYYVIIYNEKKKQLERWLDRSIIPRARYKGSVPLEISEYRVEHKLLYNPLFDEKIPVSEVPVTDGLRYNKEVNRNSYPPIDQRAAHELSYFQYKGIVPGMIYTFDVIATESQKGYSEIRQLMLGEPEPIIRLCEQNLPALQSSVPDIRRVAFDIEVQSPRDIFPVPEEAEFPVHAVAFYDSDNRGFMYYLGYHPNNEELENIQKQLGYIPEINVFSEERQLLRMVFSKMTEYPMIMGYNSDNFDLPYLLNRAIRINKSNLLKYGKQKANRMWLDPPIYPGRKHGKQVEYQVHGAIHIDLFRFFNNNAVRLYAYGGKYSRVRLDDVAEALLGEKKVQHDLWFDEMTRDQMVIYNIKDVELTLKLTSFSDNLTMNLIFTLMRVGKFSITFLTRESISNWIINWIAYEHRKNGMVMPNKKDVLEQKGGFVSESEGDKQYQGAIVLDPKEAGIFWDVTVADFASLYPSIIKKYRLSYETMRCHHEECTTNLVPDLSHWVCTKQQGIMSSLVGYVRDIRVKWFKPLTKSSNKQEAVFAKTIQQALKVFINASYGVFGTQSFALFCPPLAESTTAYARRALLESKRVAEEMGLEVLYGDTDSIFIHKLTEEQFKLLYIWSIVELGIEMGIDYTFRFLVLSGKKKNYFGVTTDGGIIVKGLQVKKSNTAIFIQETFVKVTDMLRKVNTPEELEETKNSLVSILREAVDKLKRGEIPLEKLAKMVSMRKSPEDYDSTSLAVQIAIQLMEDGKDTEIARGSQFMTVSVKPFKQMVRTTAFVNLAKRKLVRMGYEYECSVKQVNDTRTSEIDVKKYLEALKNSFASILEPFGMEWNEIIKPQLALNEYF